MSEQDLKEIKRRYIKHGISIINNLPKSEEEINYAKQMLDCLDTIENGFDKIIDEVF